MEIARSFRDLRTYKLARESAGNIFQMTRSFPSEERYSLTDQIRRSSRAVNAMIEAETGPAQAAPETGMPRSTRFRLIDLPPHVRPTQFRNLDAQWQSMGGMLNRMMDRSADFCKVDTRTLLKRT